ncbi:Afadin and alpha-actinin-binding-domain-containing protein [Haematococcus lacustris]
MFLHDLAGLADQDDVLHQLDSGVGASTAYATASNVDSCAKYVCQALSGLGYSPNLDLFSSGPEAVAGVVNTLFALIQQRHVDKEARDALENVARTLRSDLQVSNSERRRLEQRMAEKLTELGNLELKLRSAERAASEGAGAASGRQEQLARRCRKLEATTQQLEHRLRAKEQEVESLRLRASAALSSKGGSVQPAAASRHAGHGCSTGHAGGEECGDQGSTQGQGAVTASHGPHGRSAPTVSNNTTSTADLRSLKRQLSDSKALVAILTEEKAALTGKLEELQHDFRRLVARCESMGLGLAPTDAASLQPQAVTTSSIEGLGSMAGGSAWWASAASGLRSELDEGELQHYMQTELKVVQDRCRQLMRGSSAKASCGAGDSVAELDSAQEVTQLQKVLKDQDLALSRSLTSLRRAESQLEAAQQRAAASQQRALLLERRLTEASQASLAHDEQEEQLQQQVARLCKVVKETQAEAEQWKQEAEAAQQALEVQRLAPSSTTTAVEAHAASLAAELEASQAALASQSLELEMVQKQLALMKRAVVVTGGAGASRGEAVAAVVQEGVQEVYARLATTQQQLASLQQQQQRGVGKELVTQVGAAARIGRASRSSGGAEHLGLRTSVDSAIAGSQTQQGRLLLRSTSHSAGQASQPPMARPKGSTGAGPAAARVPLCRPAAAGPKGMDSGRLQPGSQAPTPGHSKGLLVPPGSTAAAASAGATLHGPLPGNFTGVSADGPAVSSPDWVGAACSRHSSFGPGKPSLQLLQDLLDADSSTDEEREEADGAVGGEEGPAAARCQWPLQATQKPHAMGLHWDMQPASSESYSNEAPTRQQQGSEDEWGGFQQPLVPRDSTDIAHARQGLSGARQQQYQTHSQAHAGLQISPLGRRQRWAHVDLSQHVSPRQLLRQTIEEGSVS